MKEKEATWKELEKTKSKLKDTESKLRNTIQDKVRLEVSAIQCSAVPSTSPTYVFVLAQTLFFISME